jgi:hypothetical protein
MNLSLHFRRRWLLLVAALLFAGIWLASAWYILAQPLPLLDPSVSLEPDHRSDSVNNFPNCRYGLGGSVEAYSVTQLNLGWYMEWTTTLAPFRPNGAEYVQVVRLKYYSGTVIFNPPLSSLPVIIDQNPGALWLIGNEPDSPYQDNLRPEDYAHAYQQAYVLIKAEDSSARVGAGNIVQPTPLRLQYLDRVLQAYQQAYHQALPADVWSIHSYILRELSPYDPQACLTIDPNTGQCSPGPLSVWGADIPPGITATRGILYELSDMFKDSIFQQRLIDFRQWMRDRGYQQTPLYISEYGTLFPYPPYSTYLDDQGHSVVFTYTDELGHDMTEARTALFMTRTFNVLQNLSSSATGYSADDNHLVQRWLWYSVADPKFGGLLFDPTTHQPRPLGDVFAAYTAAISPTVDWVVAQAWANPVLQAGGLPATATLYAQISNSGNVSTSATVTATFYDGPIGQPGTQIITRKLITPYLSGCGDSLVLSVNWPGLTAGPHPFVVSVQAASPEHNLNNNILTGTLLVATKQLWLPLLSRAN